MTKAIEKQLQKGGLKGYVANCSQQPSCPNALVLCLPYWV